MNRAKARAKTRSKSRSKAKVTRAKPKARVTKTRKPINKAKSKTMVKTRSKTRSKGKSKTVRRGGITIQEARNIGDKLGIDFSVVPVKEFQYGMKVELEHGRIDKRTNVTNDDLMKTGKIVLAHLLEFPDYYARLKKMEEAADNYWKGKKKPSVIKQGATKKK